MLTPLLVSVSLRRLRPGPPTVRDPLPLIRYDRAREPRATRHLARLSSALARGGFHRPLGSATVTLHDASPATTTATAQVSWAAAVFLQSG